MAMRLALDPGTTPSLGRPSSVLTDTLFLFMTVHLRFAIAIHSLSMGPNVQRIVRRLAGA